MSDYYEMKLADKDDHIAELNMEIGKLRFLLRTLLVNPQNRINRDAVMDYLDKNRETIDILGGGG